MKKTAGPRITNLVLTKNRAGIPVHIAADVDGIRVAYKVNHHGPVKECAHYVHSHKEIDLDYREHDPKVLQAWTVHEYCEAVSRWPPRGEGLGPRVAHRVVATPAESRHARKIGLSPLVNKRETERIWRLNYVPGVRRRK